MLERGIDWDEVIQVLKTRDMIEDYPNDIPFPSRLVLGWCGGRPVQVVAAENALDQETIVITAYEPDPARWDPSFRRRTSR